MPFNPQQKQAIRSSSGPLMVLAGPGSGKTTVITQHLLYLLQQKKIPEDSILVLTYTRAAAAEMHSRFLQLFGKQQCRVRFGTFHSLFYRILREEGLFRNVRLMEEGEALAHIACWIKGHSSLSRDEAFECAQAYLSQYTLQRSTLEKKQMLPEESVHLYTGAISDYEAHKRRTNRIDYDDLLTAMYAYLGPVQHRRHLQQRFPCILVDEVQDVNRLQYEILRRLTGSQTHLFLVGDDDQSIYGFRGAGKSLMLQFPKDFPSGQILSLKLNYRCRAPIVSLASAVIEHNRDRFPKALEAVQKAPLFSRCVRIRSFASEAEEACAIAHWVETHSNGSCSILLRTIFAARSLTVILENYGFVFSVGARPVYPSAHWIGADVKEARAAALGDRQALSALFHKLYPSSPAAVLDWLSPHEGLDELLAHYRMDEELYPVLLEYRHHLKRIASEAPLAVLKRLHRKMHYTDYLQRQAERLKLPGSVLLDRLDEWEERLYGISWDVFSDPAFVSDKTGPVRCVIQTMHSSKGMEFDHVWIPQLIRGVFPDPRNPDPEEERRLFYVAMTRARKSLTLSRPEEQGGASAAVSSFFQEALAEKPHPVYSFFYRRKD